MAVTYVGSTKFTPSASASTRNLTLPANILPGDVILIHSAQAGGSTTITPSGLANLTEVGTQSFTGHKQYLWIKENADSADAGAIVTFASSTALRITLECVVYRGVPSSAVIDVWAGANGATGGGTSVTTPSVTTTVANDLEIQFVAGSGAAGLSQWQLPAGLTLASESYDAGTGGGASYGAIGYIPGGQAVGATPGGDVWNVTATSSTMLLSAFTVAIKVAAAATAIRPSSVVSNPGALTNQGGAGSIQAALADESDATFIETPDSPSGAAITLGFPELGAGPIRVKVRHSMGTTTTPALKVVYDLMQGSTVIATRTVASLPTAVADYSFDLTNNENSAVTDRTALRLRATYSAA